MLFSLPSLVSIDVADAKVSPAGPGRFLAELPLDVDCARAALRLTSGEIVHVVVPLPRRYVRLWKDIVSREEAPLDGSAVLTERMVFAHACVEARWAPDRELFIEDEGGARLVTARTDRHGRGPRAAA